MSLKGWVEECRLGGETWNFRWQDHTIVSWLNLNRNFSFSFLQLNAPFILRAACIAMNAHAAVNASEHLREKWSEQFLPNSMYDYSTKRLNKGERFSNILKSIVGFQVHIDPSKILAMVPFTSPAFLFVPKLYKYTVS
jgi:hypothetical protein